MSAAHGEFFLLREEEAIVLKATCQDLILKRGLYPEEERQEHTWQKGRARAEKL